MPFQKGHKIWLGKHHTKETKEKLSKNTSARRPEVRLKMSLAKKGKKLSEEHKRKISEIAKKKGFGLWMRGREISKEIRKKMYESRRGKYTGEKATNWRGGKSFEPYTIDWTETLRRSIRERDNYICQLCNQYGNTVHHIDYDKKNCSPNNLITLCLSCNSKVNFNREYWKQYFQRQCLSADPIVSQDS